MRATWKSFYHLVTWNTAMYRVEQVIFNDFSLYVYGKRINKVESKMYLSEYQLNHLS